MGNPSDEDDGAADLSGRIDRLAERAREDAAAFDPPREPPDERAARTYLVDGAGEALGVYLDARTGGELYRFGEREYERLEEAFNTWLGLYAACYGVEMDPSVTLRTAAEAFVDTHDLVAVARTVTGVGPDSGDEPL